MSPRTRWIASLVTGYLAMQAADFTLTWLLLAGGTRPDVYEANPLARSILEAGGWQGLALFKAAVACVALGAALALLARRHAAGTRLLAGMFLVMLGVNVYSGTLLSSGGPGVEDEHAAAIRDRTLSDLFGHNLEFVARRDAVLDEVLVGGKTRAEAMGRMREEVRHFIPLLKMPPAGRLPDPSREDEVALYFDYHLRARAALRGVTTQVAYLSAEPTLAERLDPLTPPWLQVR